MSPEDVAYLVELHAGFVGVPAGLHATLCHKLVGGVLDAGASFYIAEDGDSAALETRALVDLTAEGDVWLCEYAATFSSRNDLLSLVQQEGGDESGVARPLHTLAALPPGAGAASVVDVLLQSHSRLLPEIKSAGGAAAAAGSHFICDGFGAAFGDTALGSPPSCCSSTIFSPLHGRHFDVFWAATALSANELCTVRRDDGCYFPNAKGGNAHLHRVASPRYRALFNLHQQQAAAGAGLTVAAAATALAAPATASGSGGESAGSETADLTNLSPDPARPLLVWKDFLLPDELEYLRGLVYDGDAESFGTQFVKQAPAAGAAAAAAPAPVSDADASSSSDEEKLDSDTMALVAAALAEQNPGGDGGSGATKNRLRTSHFLRTVWWRSGRGLEVFNAISARAGKELGLPACSAEAPQVVCYPGGLSYFRPHHDSGRLLAAGQTDNDDSDDRSSTSSSSDSSDDDGGDGAAGSDGPSWVNLDRDHYGAAR